MHSAFLFISKGIGLTLILLLGSVILGIAMGTFMAVLYHKNHARLFIRAWISLMRGTPLILQLTFVYYTASSWIGHLSILTTGIITFGMNSAAYMAEILRSGIENIPQGQYEAAKTLNIPPFFMWKDIILPQVLRNIFPALINEIITVLKETALIGVITGMDIMRHAQILGAAQFTYFMPLCVAGLYYYALTACLTLLGHAIEKKMRIVPERSSSHA